MRKKSIVLVALLMFVAALVACGGNEPASTAVPTQVPPTAPATLPAIEQPIATFCDNVDPSFFQMNTMGLPYAWQANCVSASPYDASQPPGPKGLPDHVQINMGSLDPAGRSPFDPVLYIIPAAEYQQLWDAAGDSYVTDTMGKIKDLIAAQPTSLPPSGNPVLPVEELMGQNDLAVQGTYVNLGNAEGYRFVGRFAQDANPVTNQGLRYIFQGFAGENQEYFVAFFYPVSTPYLPNSAGDVTPEEMSRFNNDPQAHIAERATYLNSLDPGDWDPMLTLLDQLLASVEYTGGTTEVVPTIEPPTPEPQVPNGTVTAPLGVNLRSGPGTSFPVIGGLDYQVTFAITGRSADGLWWVTPIQGAPNNQGWVSASFVQASNTAAVPIVPAPPPPVPTATPIPTPGPQIDFWADRTAIDQGECTTLRWRVEDVQAVWVYPAGTDYTRFPATGIGSRLECPPVTTTYEMRVLKQNGNTEFRQVSINVTPGNPLANTSWVVSTLNINQLPLSGSVMTLYFSGTNTVSGNTACNTFNGPYSVNGTSLAIGPLSTTKLLCADEINGQEQVYLSALQTATRYELSGSQLILFDATGQEVARFFRTG